MLAISIFVIMIQLFYTSLGDKRLESVNKTPAGLMEISLILSEITFV